MSAADAPPIPATLISSLNEEQKAAVLHGRGAALVLAGAGSGKTRVLTHRIAGLISVGVPAFNILALTFTNKAAKEMKERVNQLLQAQGLNPPGQVSLQTFHAFGAIFLRQHADKLNRSQMFLIYDRDDQVRLIKEVLKQQKIELDREGLKDLCAAFDTAKQLGKSADEAYCPPLDQRPGVDVRRLGWAYEQALIAADAFDFGDLIVKPLKLLQGDPELQEQTRRRYSWVLVDEFQDTNRAQLLLLQALCPPHGDIFVVGDDDQSIYAWRGAEVSNILGFSNHFPNAKTYKLQQNYRSKGNILNAANGVIRYNSGRLGKRLWTDQDDGSKLTLYTANNEYDEAQFVAEQSKNLVESGRYRYGDIAVLYRANSLSLTFENALMNYDIPHVIVKGRHFFERAEIRDALAYLRLLINPHDLIAYQRAIGTESRGVGQTSLARIIRISHELKVHLFEAAQEAVRMGVLKGKAIAGVQGFYQLYTQGKYLDHERLAEQAKALLIEAKLYRPEYLTDMVDEIRRARTENLSRLIDLIDEFEDRHPDASWFSFLEQVKLISDDEGSQDGQSVQKGRISLMTVHASKGLEFPVVFVVGLEENLFPSARKGGASELEEERRLFYVAVTRAEKRLVLSYAKQRTVHGQKQPRMMSQFLSEVDQGLFYKAPHQSDLLRWAQKQEYSSSRHSQTTVATKKVAAYKQKDKANSAKSNAKKLRSLPEQNQKTINKVSHRTNTIQTSKLSPGTKVIHKTYGIGQVHSVERKMRGEAARVLFGQTEKVILTSFLTQVPSQSTNKDET